MRTRRSFRFLAVPSFVLLAALAATEATAFADDEEPAATPPPPEPPWRGTRLAFDVSGGFGGYYRSNRPTYFDQASQTYGVARGSEGGFELGGSVHVHPHQLHGFFVGGSHGGGVFGPTVTILNLGYSIRIGAPTNIRGVFFDGLVDIGPAMGFVQNASVQPDHVALGGHVAASAQLNFWNFYLGARIAGNAGASTAPGGGLDAAYMFSLNVGFTVDARPAD